MSTQSPNVTHLKSAIDGGKTGDKVPFSDPAAAPLGTDEEAAGTPLPASAIQTAYHAETGRADIDTDPDRKLVNGVIIAVAVAIVGLAGFAVMMVYQYGI